MDGGAWWAAVHGIAKSQTRLSDFTFPFHFHALELLGYSLSSAPASLEPQSPGLAWTGNGPFSLKLEPACAIKHLHSSYQLMKL